MNKLLRANFTRLWKNKFFFGCIIFMFVDALNTVISQYISFKKYGGEKSLYFTERLALDQTVAVSIITAIFVGLFIGTEYSNGTIRNKLIIGHSRIAMYFSNLAVCIAAAVMIHVTYVVTALLGGLIAFGSIFTNAEVFIKLFAVTLIVVTAFAAMLLPISIHITSKSAGVTTTIMLTVVLLIFAVIISQGLSEPEVYEAYTIIDANGEEYSEPEMKNPFYVGGVQREIYKVLYDVLPTCHAVRIQIDDMPENPAVIPLWSAAVIVVTTSAGAVFFRRKDLK